MKAAHIAATMSKDFILVSIFYRLLLRASLVRVSFKGKMEKIEQPVLFVANHQSVLDAVLIGSLIGSKPHLWFAKKELRGWFLIGLWLSRMSVFVDAESPYAASKSLIKGLALLEKYHLNAIVFPEGGRFVDGKIHLFFAGFAVIAKRIGYPVVPIRIEDAYKAYPPGSFLARDYPVTVTIGKPFVCGAEESYQEFAQRVYSWFIDSHDKE